MGRKKPYLLGVSGLNFVTIRGFHHYRTPRSHRQPWQSLWPCALRCGGNLNYLKAGRLTITVVLGGSNFRMNTNTANLRNSECTSIPIPEDKSNYWFPVGYVFFFYDDVHADGILASLFSVSPCSNAYR